ncbi:Uncharacterised protein [Bacteroides uniformis]|uniref:Uncharacterized protein n=1 Tax=Bacteroides uniformis TaxID=820 RepID=A0A6N2QV31_BACUN
MFNKKNLKILIPILYHFFHKTIDNTKSILDL